jgi:anti-sigma regulatory factor (Ser/Thr protein kinase)
MGSSNRPLALVESKSPLSAMDGWSLAQTIPMRDPGARARAESRFELTQVDLIPCDGRTLAEQTISQATHVRELRQKLEALLVELGASAAVVSDLQLAISEAGTNAFVHGGGGHCWIRLQDDRLIVRITDCGPGIAPSCVEQAVFVPGFSTADSCGMGYTLMLELTDRVWLATGTHGTVVQLEKRIYS